MEKLSIIKIGGNIIEDAVSLAEFLNLFSKIEGPKILIHGGGKRATEVATKLGIVSKMIDGRRITNAETLEVITMVYAGLVNKNIVAKLQGNHINAIGLTGADANCIEAVKRPVKDIDYGFVGDIVKVNDTAINALLKADFTPVFCAITHNTNGQLLNTNADTVAAQVAVAMSALYKTSLYYCFELKGVLEDINDKNSVIKHINTATYQTLLSKGIIADGMLPKLSNCFDALKNGVHAIKMGNTEMLENNNTNYTTITL